MRFSARPFAASVFALVVAAVLLPGLVRAQSYEGSLRFGATLTSFSGERVRFGETQPFDFDWGSALTGSGGLRVRFPNGLAVGGDIAYLLARTTNDDAQAGLPTGEVIPASVRFQLTSITIPVLARYTLGTLTRFHPMVAVGGYASRLSEARETIRRLDGELLIERPSTEPDDSPSFVTWDYGLAAEAGVEIDVAGERIEVAARYAYGLTDIQTRETSEVYSRTFSFTLGFLF